MSEIYMSERFLVFVLGESKSIICIVVKISIN